MRTAHGSTGSRLAGIGAYRPEASMSNAELAARYGKTEDWIESRTGMRTRALAGPTETVASMAAIAGERALSDARVQPEEVDLVITASCSLDTPLPSAGAVVASELGCKSAGAFDLNAACSGFCYSLALASDVIRSGSARTVLVTGSERFSGWLDTDDLGTSIIFGDGAGAAVVIASDDAGIGPVVWGSDGTGADLITMATPDRSLRMEGRKVFRWATSEIHPVALNACEQAGVDPGELAAIVPHQANLRIVDAIADKIGAPQAVVARDGVETGNTSAASIPIALRRLMDTGAVSSGDLALLIGFGAGLAFAGQVVRVP